MIYLKNPSEIKKIDYVNKLGIEIFKTWNNDTGVRRITIEILFET